MAKQTDGRSRAARRFRTLVTAFADDLGGISELSAAETALINQAAAITLQAEQLQSGIINGDLADSDKLVRLTNSACRILTSLASMRGKQRRVRRFDMDEYLGAGDGDQKQAEKES
jgi:hypothetical protein